MPPTTRLPRTTRIFLAGNTVSMLGTGLTFPFLLIYLNQVRDLALPIVGALLAGAAAAGLVAVLISGPLLDRMGARRVLFAILLGQACAEVLLAWAHSVPTALPGTLLYGATWAPMIPTIRTMIAGLTPQPVMQQRAFAINFIAQNAAIGTGAAVGAAVAHAQNPESFQILFLANGASCLLFAIFLFFVPNTRRERIHDETKAGYRDVLAHPGLRLVIAASLLIYFVGTPAFDSGLPAFATVVAHASIQVVALSYTLNTVIIVATQLLVLRLLRRSRRSRALTVAGLLLAVSWMVFGFASLPLPSAVRVACVLGFSGLFGLGETFIVPTMGPLVNSLADDRVRGRANALASSGYALALIVSPAIATGLIAAGAAAVWIGLLCLGCLGTVAIGIRLGRRLTTEQDRVGAPTPAVGAPATPGQEHSAPSPIDRSASLPRSQPSSEP